MTTSASPARDEHHLLKSNLKQLRLLRWPTNGGQGQ